MPRPKSGEFDKSKYDQNYMKKNVTRKLLAFNKANPEDVEILEWLERQGNMTEYIKRLIREDMENQPIYLDGEKIGTLPK